MMHQELFTPQLGAEKYHGSVGGSTRALEQEWIPALQHVVLYAASAVLMVPLRNQLLQKTLTPKGESQTARPLQHSLLLREGNRKHCSYSFNSFKELCASRRFHEGSFFLYLVGFAAMSNAHLLILLMQVPP